MSGLEEQGLIMEIGSEGCWHDPIRMRSKEKGTWRTRLLSMLVASHSGQRKGAQHTGDGPCEDETDAGLSTYAQMLHVQRLDNRYPASNDIIFEGTVLRMWYSLGSEGCCRFRTGRRNHWILAM